MDYYLIFYSIHHLLQAEKLCHSAGIPINLVPIPREITSDCGMAIEFNGSLLEPIVATLSRSDLKHAGIFRRGPEGITRLDPQEQN